MKYIALAAALLLAACSDRPERPIQLAGLETPAIESTTVALSWIPPTERTDGSALTSIDYYIIYSGSNINFTTPLTHAPSGVTEFFLANRPREQWYGIKAVSDGVTSRMSNMVRK